MDMQNVTTPEVNQEAPKSKLGLFALIGVVLVTVLGGGVYYFGFAGKDAPPSLPSGGGMQGYIAGQASGIPYAEKADVDAWKVPDELKTATLAEVTMSKDAFAYFVAPKTMSLKEIYEKYIPPVEKQAVMVAIYDAESGKFITTKQSKQAWKTVTTVNDAKVVAKDQGFIVFGTSPKIKTYLKPVTTEPASVDLDKLQLGWNLTGLSKINFENVMKLPEYTAVYNLNSTTLVFEEVSDTVKPADLKNFLFWVKKVDPKTVTTTGTTQTGTTTTTPKLEVTTTLDSHDKLVTTWKPVSTATKYEVTVDNTKYTVDAAGKVSPETSGVTSEKKADGSYSLTITGVTKTTVPVIVEAFKDSTSIAGAKEEKSAVKATATGTVVDLGTKDGLALEAEPQDKAVLLKLILRPDQSLTEEEVNKIMKAFKGLTLTYKVDTTDKSATLTYDQANKKFTVSGNTDVTVVSDSGIFKVSGLKNDTKYTFTAKASYDGYKSDAATVEATPKAGEESPVTATEGTLDVSVASGEGAKTADVTVGTKAKEYSTFTFKNTADSKIKIKSIEFKLINSSCDYIANPKLKTVAETSVSCADGSLKFPVAFTVEKATPVAVVPVFDVTASAANRAIQLGLTKVEYTSEDGKTPYVTAESLATTPLEGQTFSVKAAAAAEQPVVVGEVKIVSAKLDDQNKDNLIVFWEPVATATKYKVTVDTKEYIIVYNEGGTDTLLSPTVDHSTTGIDPKGVALIAGDTDETKSHTVKVEAFKGDVLIAKTKSDVTVAAKVVADTVVADALAVDTTATTTTDTTITLSLTDLTVPDTDAAQFTGLKVTYFTSGDSSATPAVAPGTPVSETFTDVTANGTSNDVAYDSTSTPKTLTISGLKADTEYSIKLELTYKAGYTSKTGVVPASAATKSAVVANSIVATAENSSTVNLTFQSYWSKTPAPEPTVFTVTYNKKDDSTITKATITLSKDVDGAVVGKTNIPNVTYVLSHPDYLLVSELDAVTTYTFKVEATYADNTTETIGTADGTTLAAASLNYGFASLFDNILDSLFNLFR